MCFSASASFIAGLSLTAVGTISMTRIKKPSQAFFASIPLLFGLQQLCEGFVWLSLTDPDYGAWHNPAKYGFLLFAQIIWPFWIPLSYLRIEPSLKRKQIMQWFLYGGIAISLLLCYRVLFFAAEARIDGCHIAYDIGSTPIMQIATAILYLGTIVIIPFFTTWKWGIILATVNLVSLCITQFFYELYFVSIWCFFAAVQSVLVIMVMREINKNTSPKS